MLPDDFSKINWNPPPLKPLFDWRQVMHDLMERQSTMLNDLGRAYFMYTGLYPDEVQLVQTTDGAKIIWYYEKKVKVPADCETAVRLAQIEALEGAFKNGAEWVVNEIKRLRG